MATITAQETNKARLKNIALAKGGTSDPTQLTKDEKFDISKAKALRTKAANAKYMSYPIARSPSEETGDTLLIRCLEYKEPINSDPTAQITAENLVGVADKNDIDADGYPKEGVKTELLTKTTVNGKVIDNRPKDKDGKLKPIVLRSNFKQANQRMLEHSKTLYYIELPIPQEVNDANQVVWGDDTLNALELAGLTVAQKAMQGNFGDNAVTVAQTAIQSLQRGVQLEGLENSPQVSAAIRASISGAAINSLGSNVSQKSILSRSTGQILNSNLELLFQGMTLRSFPFSVTFTPRNSDETLVVRNIIRHLKQSMAPKAQQFNGSSATGIFLKSPDLFSLQYRHGRGDHPFLNAFKICALTGMSVNYTNAGTYASYADGTPVAIRVNLTFKEINPIYAEDYDQPMAGNGVGY